MPHNIRLGFTNPKCRPFNYIIKADGANTVLTCLDKRMSKTTFAIFEGRLTLRSTIMSSEELYNITECLESEFKESD